MTDRKLLGNAIENPNAMLTLKGIPYATLDTFLSSSFYGDVYIMDGTERLKTNIAEIMRMIRARGARALIPLPAPPETGDK